MNIVLWVFQGLLALGFAVAGGSKLAGTDQMVQLFDDVGAGQWLRFVIGALEVAAAISLLIPRLAGLAALGLVFLMVGAVITELAIDGNPASASAFLVLSAVVAWGRRSRTAALVRQVRRA
jgi:putative oxidoreductase